MRLRCRAMVLVDKGVMERFSFEVTRVVSVVSFSIEALLGLPSFLVVAVLPHHKMEGKLLTG